LQAIKTILRGVVTVSRFSGLEEGMKGVEDQPAEEEGCCCDRQCNVPRPRTRSTL
jgi:hypothetical protein